MCSKVDYDGLAMSTFKAQYGEAREGEMTYKLFQRKRCKRRRTGLLTNERALIRTQGVVSIDRYALRVEPRTKVSTEMSFGRKLSPFLSGGRR